MGRNSQIEWTHHTFNPWWGCSKVSAACDNCYAETATVRNNLQVWGKAAPRKFADESVWKNPLKWNKQAEKLGVRHRVFCASMSDVFEDRDDLKFPRKQLWDLIRETPHLDWLLLTKRPQNIESMIDWDVWPENIWLGATIEDQVNAGKRLPHLLKHKAKVRFLSCEPLLGDLDLTSWINVENLQPIDWVITGGESGDGARPTSPNYFRNLRDQCIKNEIAFQFKQWGRWGVFLSSAMSKTIVESQIVDGEKMFLLGKKNTGRLLDGEIWDELPQVSLVLQTSFDELPLF